MKKFSEWPIWLRLTSAIWCCLVIAWSGLIAWETTVSRDIAVSQAKDLASSMNEMTLAGLTGMMMTGTVGQRDVFLDQIKELSAVRELRVIRGDAVSKQFGPAMPVTRPMRRMPRKRAPSPVASPLLPSNPARNWANTCMWCIRHVPPATTWAKTAWAVIR
jgi:hypothetical protein